MRLFPLMNVAFRKKKTKNLGKINSPSARTRKETEDVFLFSFHRKNQQKIVILPFGFFKGF